MNDCICIGEFIKPHGICGELLFITYNPLSDALDLDIPLFMNENCGLERIKIEKIRRVNKGYLIKLYGVNSIESAENFKKVPVFVKKDDINLNRDEYLISDLIGLNCYDESNRNIGTVSEIYPGETDIIEIKSYYATYLIPMTDDNISCIDIKNLKITVKNEENYKI
ncbi:MAG: ribosome maturation factor RimM [Deltaproteobacteria bacterium]|jgi:16S rRNA processing protein RimM|nr:ribosome maturation factor RimM [Deltaproteobacteria bacterium]